MFIELDSINASANRYRFRLLVEREASTVGFSKRDRLIESGLAYVRQAIQVSTACGSGRVLSMPSPARLRQAVLTGTLSQRSRTQLQPAMIARLATKLQGLQLQLHELQSSLQGLQLQLLALHLRLQTMQLRLQGMQLRLQGMQLRLQGLQLWLQTMQLRLQALQSRFLSRKS
jgi:hypothetical protein